MMIKRKVWPITAREIGFNRISFIFIVILTAILSLLIMFGTVFSFKDNMLHPFGQSIWLFQDIQGIISLSIIFVFIFLFIITISYLLLSKIKQPNISWFELQTLGERKIGIADMFLLITTISFFFIHLFTQSLAWYHLFVFVSLCTANILNFKSGPEDVFIKPSVTPEPEQIPETEPDTDDDATTPKDDEYITHNFEWSSSAGGPFLIESFRLSKSEYENAQQKNRNDLIREDGFYENDQKFAERVTLGLTNDLSLLINKISQTHKNKNNLVRIDNLLQFVHDPNFKYSYDEETTPYVEYARFPIETLVERTGDCECLSILVAALFKLHGYKAALLLTSNHCIAGVEVPGNIQILGKWVESETGVKYWICEATGSGWTVGEYTKSDSFKLLPV